MAKKLKNRVDPDSALTLAKQSEDHLREMMDALKGAKAAIDTMANGDGKTAYWSGTTAMKWYAASYKNIANSYVRIANIANSMSVICQYAIRVIKTDTDTDYYGYTPQTLAKVQGAIESVRKTAIKEAKALATNLEQ